MSDFISNLPTGTKFATSEEQAKLNKVYYDVADKLAQVSKEHDCSVAEVVTVTLQLLAGMVHVADLDVENVMELLKFSVERINSKKTAN